MKNQKYFFLLLITLFLNLTYLIGMQSPATTPPMPSPEEIEKIMESPEFKQMMEELDKIFGEEEEEEEDIDKKEDKKTPEKELDKKTEPESKKLPEKPKTIEESFKLPAKSDKEADDKIVKKLDAQKVKAFNYYMEQLTHFLGIIERKINSFDLGIAFKEEMDQTRINKTLNQINICINFIKSKKLYLKIFYLPMFTKLRELILSTIKELKKLEPDLNNPDLVEKSFNSDFEYLQKLAKKSDKESNKIKFNNLQKKIESIFKKELKEIEQKLLLITQNSQIKDELNKKIEKRKQLQKEAERKKDSKGSFSGYQPSYRQHYSGYPSYSGQSSRPRSYDSSGYGSGYSPSSYSSSRGLSSDYSKKDRDSDSSKPSYDSSKISDTKKDSTPKVAVKGDKLQAKYNIIKNLTDKSSKLINDIKNKFGNGNIENIKDIYDSKLLSQLDKNISEIEKNKSGIDENQLTIKDLSNKLNNEIIKNASVLIPLAKNKDKKESVAALNILNTQDDKIKPALKIYEDNLVKEIEKQKSNLEIFTSSSNDFESLKNNLKNLNQAPKFSQEKVSAINKQIQDLAVKTLKDFPDLKTLEQIEDGVGKANIEIKGSISKIQTEKDVYLALDKIENENTKEYLIKSIKNFIPEPKKSSASKDLTVDQKSNLINKFETITSEFTTKKKFLEMISAITKRE